MRGSSEAVADIVLGMNVFWLEYQKGSQAYEHQRALVLRLLASRLKIGYISPHISAELLWYVIH